MNDDDRSDAQPSSSDSISASTDSTSHKTSDDARRRNRQAWDRMADSHHPFTRPAKEEALKNPLATVDSVGWLGNSIHGKELLCLAAGGGKHSVIYATAGARVTVVDLSPAMLELDRKVSAELGLNVRVVEASMDDLSELASQQFDIVIHPVSSCYLPDPARIFQEVARVIKPNGLYVSQHKQPTSLQASLDVNSQGRYEILEPRDRRTSLPIVERKTSLREPGTSEFIHTWESLLGHMCRAGFLIEDLVEPWHGDVQAAPGSFGHRARYIPPYVRVKARRTAADKGRSGNSIWIP